MPIGGHFFAGNGHGGVERDILAVGTVGFDLIDTGLQLVRFADGKA